MRASLARAAAVDDQRVIHNLEAAFIGDLTLTLLDGVVDELLDPTTLLANDVVVVTPAV